MENQIIDLHDDYNKGDVGRREFMKKLALLAGSTAAAFNILAGLESNYAIAETISPQDPDLTTDYIKYQGQDEMTAYFARPKGTEKLPAVIVIHENRGLNPHIEDVARRAAKAGFLAIAPNALSPVGGTPEDSNEARTKMSGLEGETTQKNFVAAVEYLKTHPQSTGKVGCVGFCWGGRMTNAVAVNSPDLKAAVPYYGSQPKAEDVPKIKASLLLQYAGNDRRVNAGFPAYGAALEAQKHDYQVYFYPGASHAFNNDTSETRYHKEAAELAWSRTIAFFKEKLS